MMKVLCHCSFEPVEKFVPRIPSQRCPTEDDTIPRICVSENIKYCINAIPQGVEVLQYMQKLEMPMIVHVYYFAEECYEPMDIVGYVPDAVVSHEHWIMTKPSEVRHQVIRITDFFSKQVTDQYGVKHGMIVAMDYENEGNASLHDNMLNLARVMEVPEEMVKKEPFTDLDFRTIMFQLGDKFVEMLEKEEEKNN